MKKAGIIFLSIITVIVINAQKSEAQDIARANIRAEIINPTSAEEKVQLSFGLYAYGPNGGLVFLSPKGYLATEGMVFEKSNTYTPATFQINGIQETAVSISLSSGSTVLNHNEGSKTMKVYDWISVPESNTGAYKLDEAGSLAVNVGATLDMSNTDDYPVGLYAGTYSITFDYN